MALRTRQQNLQNALGKAVASKPLGLHRTTRNALGNIQNNVAVVSKNELASKKQAVVKPRTTKNSLLNKENQVKDVKKLLPALPGKLVKDQSSEVAKPVARIQPIVEQQPEADLSASLMDISISEQEGFSSCILPEGITDIDSEDADNPFMCSDVVMDIYNYLRELEVKWSIRPGFLLKQNDITPRMRGILVDWLNQVHSRFGLLQETLYLTIATIDRFLQEHEVSRKQLQLVGVTAMFIASKYEEMYAPAVEDFVYITDRAYSKHDIFKMEYLMLKTLQFSFGRPLPLHFLRRNSKAGSCDALVHTIAKYLMELSLQDYELAAVRPSVIAAAALRLSLLVMDNAQWTDDLAFYSNYKEHSLMPVMSQMARLVLRNSASKLQSVHKKYGSSKFMRVSTLPQLTSQAMENIAAGVSLS